MMGLEHQIFDIDAAASLLGWWRDAGVDVAVGETPHAWLGAPVTAISIKAPVAVAAVLPTAQSIDALVDHLMTADISDAGPPARRIGPTGAAASDLMILTDFPDAADFQSGALLGDSVFTKMLDAIGHTRTSVYIASLCPGRPMTGRLTDDSIAALAALAKQHIRFVAPKQLWLVGGAASRAILGVDDIRSKGKLHKVNLLGTIMDAIATAHPRMFAQYPGSRAAAWAEMQRLIIKDDA